MPDPLLGGSHKNPPERGLELRFFLVSGVVEEGWHQLGAGWPRIRRANVAALGARLGAVMGAAPVYRVR